MLAKLVSVRYYRTDLFMSYLSVGVRLSEYLVSVKFPYTTSGRDSGRSREMVVFCSLLSLHILNASKKIILDILF